MKSFISSFAALAASSLMILACGGSAVQVSDIPLPEHPRPDFERSDFVNLNGYWNFTFDESLSQKGVEAFDQKILVPFPWGSPLSEVEDKADIAWYGREITVPSAWKGKRVFLVVGASDWETTVSIDGKELGSHQGGYTPFEFEITDDAKFGKSNVVTIKVDDTSSKAHLYGKQGYGNARGIWQTVYLEARGSQYITSVHFSPDIDNEKVKVEISLNEEPAAGSNVAVTFKKGEYLTASVPAQGKTTTFEIAMPGQHLWSLEDPYLYEVTASLGNGRKTVDAVDTYFGQRKISAEKVPGQDYKYVALNNKPIYLQLCLDQSYHPEGFYTFPSDEFMKNEIMISKELGLNGNRIHIKTEIPRKLYWADKLGLLIMADIPCFWGEPVPEAKADWEHCMRAQVDRDYNHPSIFSWVDFNETWGLFTTIDGVRAYRTEAQEWVRDMYHLTKQLDPTRLVEDNSPCNRDHVETDINSWHSYCAGYNWEESCRVHDVNTFPGSTANYIGGNVQTDAPMMNSECGNVWGYEHSTGDVDFTWDYHEMMNSFHRHPKIGGWLYTEHHDVINEWNGYVQYDRTPKYDGLGDFVRDMSIKDFHTSYYVVPDKQVCNIVPAGSVQTLRLSSSFMTEEDPGEIYLETFLTGCDAFGEIKEYSRESTPVTFKPFALEKIVDRKVELPSENGVYTLSYVLRNSKREVLSRNFSLYVVNNAPAPKGTVSFAPGSYTDKKWTIKSTDILSGLKVNGFGSGYFEYQVKMPAGLDIETKGGELIFEAGAKQLFGKDVEGEELKDLDYMLGGGMHDHCKVENAYAQTDEELWCSEVHVSVNGQDLDRVMLADDPADHRGVLSWAAQPKDRLIREGGSYGQIVKVSIPAGTIKNGSTAVIRFLVPEVMATETSGGLAIYGKSFGRYVLDPTIVVNQ